MTGEFTPFYKEAVEAVHEFSKGTGSLMEATVAVNAVRSWDAEKVKPLQVRFLQSIRAGAIRTLTEGSNGTPLQRELSARVLNSMKDMDGGDKSYREIDKVDEYGFWIPEVTESVMAMPDIGHVKYILSLSGKTPRPQDGELENIARPSISLSDGYTDGVRHVGLTFTQGTATHGTFEGIVLASTATEGTGYVPEILAPEVASQRLHNDLDAFMLNVESSALYCRALGAFSIPR